MLCSSLKTSDVLVVKAAEAWAPGMVWTDVNVSVSGIICCFGGKDISEWWLLKRQDLQCNMCELGKFNIEKYQHVIVFLYFCRVLFFKVP